MADGVVGVAQAPSPDRLIDNEAVTTGSGSVFRQRVRLGGANGTDLADVITNRLQVEAPLGAHDSTVTPIRNRFSPSTGNAVEVSTIGDTVLYTPAVGKAIRVKWLGVSSHPSMPAPVKVLLKFNVGGTPFYRWWMGAPGAFAHGVVRESAVNDVLYVNCSVAPGAGTPLLLNLDVEEF